MTIVSPLGLLWSLISQLKTMNALDLIFSLLPAWLFGCYGYVSLDFLCKVQIRGVGRGSIALPWCLHSCASCFITASSFPGTVAESIYFWLCFKKKKMKGGLLIFYRAWQWDKEVHLRFHLKLVPSRTITFNGTTANICSFSPLPVSLYSRCIVDVRV